MKLSFFATAIIFLSFSVDASDKKVLNYEGTARIISLTTGDEQTQKLLLKKTSDPQLGYLIETACIEESQAQPRLSSVYMRVNGKSLSISDSMGESKYLSGTGEVSGEDWNWNFLKFSMTAGPVQIEDVNFVIPGKLIARKQIFLIPSGLPVQLWETEMTEISEEKFQSIYKAMNCPE